MAVEPGSLHVVATPIGHLGDITQRAREVLGGVDLVAAEDTRHTARLLHHHGLRAELVSLHEHNEEGRVAGLLERLREGASVALVSDAGTPLLSDPGFRLVRAAHEAGVRVVPIPGVSSVTAALSVAGLPTDRFCFEGFLPARAAARRSRLDALAAEPRTLVLFESSHRIRAALADLAERFGAERPATLARELTKRFETVRAATLGGLVELLGADPDQRRGEFVLVVAGAPGGAESDPGEDDRVLGILLAELPLRQAAAVAARLLGRPRNALYRRALELQGD